jgi:16S rRNA (adenine1518-N6/adenine1519-N6)-dimethyltransferase
VVSRAVQSLTDIKELLEQRGLTPRKALGQNFLVDQNLLRRLVDAAQVQRDDLVLEIGPGTGALTDVLLDAGANVIACELDDALADLVAERYGSALPGRFTLIRGDCLVTKHTLNPDIDRVLAGRPFQLIANLPYGAASPVMVLLAARPDCLGQFVTIQREVAQRVMAKPNTRDYSELSILIQAMCDVRRIAHLPPECFWPRPKVRSEMLAITPRATPLTDDIAALSMLCRMLFTKRRKQVGTILGRDIDLPEDIAPTARPEQLTIEQLASLTRRLTSID